MERKIVSLEKAKVHYKENWTKALKELINGEFDNSLLFKKDWIELSRPLEQAGLDKFAERYQQKNSLSPR